MHKQITHILMLLCGMQSVILSCAGHEASIEKTILITGGAGFIGSNFLEYCFYKYPNYKFIVLDALTYAGSIDNIPVDIFNSPRFLFYHGSISNSYLVNDLMNKVDLVVNFAAESHVTRSLFDTAIFFETNVIGTRVLMDSLVRHKNIQRFVHISTSEVLGTAEEAPMTERHPLNPRTPYAASKAAADRLVYSYECTYDVPTLTVRPFNNYGPKQHPEKMIPCFLTNLLRGKSINIHGSGGQTRDWLYVIDTCRAIDMILHHQDFSSIKHEVFHIGSGQEGSVITIARTLLDKFKLPEHFLIFTEDRAGQVARHIAAIDKVRRLIGWEPQVPLEEGLQLVADWYQKNKGWWGSRANVDHTKVLWGDSYEAVS